MPFRLADYSHSLARLLQSSDYRQSRSNHWSITDGLQKNCDNWMSVSEEIANRLALNGLNAPTLTAVDDQLEKYVVIDYAAISSDQYMQDGFLFGNWPRLAGESYLQVVEDKPTLRFADASKAVSDPFWDGLEAISEKGVHDKSKLTTLPLVVEHCEPRRLRLPTGRSHVESVDPDTSRSVCRFAPSDRGPIAWRDGRGI